MLRLWERLGDWIIFGVLIVLSAATMLSRNEPMVKGFRARALALTGTVENVFSVAGSFMRALEENQSLREENIRLSGAVAQFRNDGVENDRLRALLSLSDSLEVSHLAARIISKDITQERNTFKINVGRRHGVEIDQAVVNTDGIVGKVEIVAETFAIVMSFQNTDFFVPARIQNHGSDGIIRWNGEERGILEMDHVMKTAPVAVRQEVVTSGYSEVFPPGLPIGEIVRVESPPGRPSWRVFVRPYADLGAAQHVFVLLERPEPERSSHAP